MLTQHYTNKGALRLLYLLCLFLGLVSISFRFITNESLNTLQVTTDRASAYYEAGEIITFIFSGTSGSVEYEIYYDKFTPPLKSGMVQVNGADARITFKLNEPGVLVCKARQGNQTTFAAASISPYKINALELEPDDFDAFWQRAKNELRQIPMNAQLSQHSSDEYSTTYRISLAHVNNRRVHGYISIPKGQGPFPAILTLPPFGNASNLVKPEDGMASKAGVIAMAISIHNAPPDQQDPNAYKPTDISNAEKSYDRQAILACIRAIDYLFTRNDFNKKLGVVGVSQGGGLAMITAGLDDRVNLLAFSTATHAQHLGLKYGKASGFPNYLNQAQVQNRGADYEEAVSEASKYFDAVYFAKRYKGPMLNFINYLDDVTPPATTFAAFNQVQGMKILLHSTRLKHQHGNEYWNGRYDFFRLVFPETQNAPWPWTPTTTGYSIDAGEAETVVVEHPFQLKGKIASDGQPLTIPVKWEKLSGPGMVTFSNASGIDSKATFSAAGTYLLRLTANDYSKLQQENKYYTLMDEVEITVTGRSAIQINCPENLEVTIPAGGIFKVIDLNEPTVQTSCSEGQTRLEQTAGPSTGEDVPAGTYIITHEASDACNNTATCSYLLVITEEESSLQIDCPQNLNRTIPVGSTSVAVQWNVPDVESTCFAGEPVVTQIAGPSRGSQLNAGSYTVIYKATDNCGNSDECSFSITITQNTSLEIACPGNLNRAIPAGSTSVTVQWNLPTVESTCTIGQPTLTQTAGPENGGELSAGMHTVSYSTKDNCGNTKSCSFTITVTQTTSIEITCPQNLTVTIASGTPVRWDLPQVQSTCTQGQSQLQQTAGPTNNTALSPGTYTIRYTASDNCGNSKSCSFTVTVEEEPIDGPCFPRGTHPWEEWISYLNFNKVTHTSEKEGYGDFSRVAIPVVIGNNYRIRLKAGFSGLGKAEHWVVRIDFDGDGIFQTDTETVLTRQSSAPAAGLQEVIVEGVVRIPATAQTGEVRMRVAMSRNGFTDPCANFQYGEVEDYTVVLQPGD